MTANPSDSNHRDTARSIWVFTPSRTAPEDLESILVQRHDLLKDAVERVRESALTAHKHHLLFVGPRGCGKTHFITLIVSRISTDAKASQHLRLAWLNEDETCTSLLELIIKAYSALEKRYPSEFREEDLAEAYEFKPAAALDFVTKRLLANLGSRTLVLVTENLDALFDAMGEKGQKQLRAFIQEHPKFAIVATAQRLVEDLSNRAKPFFGFFQTEHLKPLTVEQAANLLQNIARLQGKKEVTEFLTTSRGRSRVRALHHLSGGNHRIYIVLSQFITLESMDTLIGPFMKMVDELTPYYQERVRWLSPLQRKIVELLCTCESTVPVNEIARRLFATPQTISSQLQDLREKGYVESSQRGRESLYEISEPLMRICVEVKENQNNQPLRLLVDFLRVWYDEVELKRRLGLCQPESASHDYLAAALERNGVEGNLRTKLLWDDAGDEGCVGLSPVQLKQAPNEIQEALLDAASCLKSGDPQGARQALDEALQESNTSGGRPILWHASAFLNWKKGDNTAAIADYTRVIESPGAPTNQVAKALFERGFIHGQQGDNTSAIADYTCVIELPGVSPFQLARALFNRGVTHGQQGDGSAAITDYTRIIDLPSSSPAQVARALVNRGFTHGRQGDNFAAIADYTRIIELPGAPTAQVARALFNRGVTHGKQGDDAAAIADYTRVIELPGASPIQVARALNNRAVKFFQNEKFKASRSDLETLIALENAPIDDVVEAHLALSELYFGEGSWSKGVEAIHASLAIGAQNSPPHIKPPVDIIGVLFSAGLTPKGRSSHTGTLYSLYAQHAALAVLGEALVKHLGAIFVKGAPWPASDNLIQWLAAWEQAASDSPDFKLPLRLMRTGIAFIISGGKDHGILLTLTSTERSILRQALGLEMADN